VPRLYPIDAFECIRTDYSRSDHDVNTIVCHACFDSLYPWTQDWDGDHPRIVGMRIKPGGSLRYMLLNTDNYEDLRITYCDCCHRIIFNAICTKDSDDLEQREWCECEDCRPEPYADDEAKHASGEYEKMRARNAHNRRFDRREDRQAQRQRVQRRRAIVKEYGLTMPEWCQPKHRSA